MHVVIGLLLAAVLAYVVFRFLGSRAAAAPPAAASSDRAFAFLSNGLLFTRERGAAAAQVHSAYVQEAMDRRERARERHGWKQGTSFGITAGGGMRGFGDGGDAPIVATSAVFEPDGGLLYFLKDNNVGGLFRREPGTGKELRVLLKQGLHLADLALARDGVRVAACSQLANGPAHIALFAPDGSNYREVTGGDTVDSAPAWIPGVPNRLLFQSAGLARNDQGYIVAQGNASIQKLDMDSGTVTPILDDARFDFLKPRVCPAGNLHFIRRPFEAPGYGMRNMLLDTLLFPFRLLRAVFHYLNFFSLMYSRKPLTSANGPGVRADLKDILLQGRRIDAEKALREAKPVQGVPSLVPESWVLVRRDLAGEETVLATNCASYDIAPDGSIVYTNGHGVFVLEGRGPARLALSGELFGEVVAAA